MPILTDNTLKTLNDMINGFERETGTLTKMELNVIVPEVVECLAGRKGEDNAIKNREICLRMAKYGITEPRMRKIINYIRLNNLVSCLIATNNGYYIAETLDEFGDYIESLMSRESAIKAVRDALTHQGISMTEDSD